MWPFWTLNVAILDPKCTLFINYGIQVALSREAGSGARQGVQGVGEGCVQGGQRV